MKFWKKLLLINCSCLIFFTLSGNAQKGLRFGLKGAYNTTWLLNKNIIDNSTLDYIPSFGFNSGISLGYNFSHKFGLFTEALFEEHNQQFSEKGDTSSMNTSTTLYYLSVPLMIRYRFNTGIYFELGAQYYSLSSVKYGYSNENDSTTIFIYSGVLKNIDEIKNNADNNFEPTNVAIISGVGISVNLSRNLSTNLGLRFTYGLTDIVSKAGGKGTNYSNNLNYSPTKTAAAGGNLSLEYKF